MGTKDEENDLEEGSDANGGDKGSEVGEKDTGIEKDDSKDESYVRGGNNEMEMDKMVAEDERDVSGGNKEM